MGATLCIIFGRKFRSIIHFLVALCKSRDLLLAPDQSATDHPIFEKPFV